MNPINQILQGQQPRRQQNNQMNIISLIANAKRDPEGTYNELMRTNPEFARFINANMNKTINQIKQENGISDSDLNNLM